MLNGRDGHIMHGIWEAIFDIREEIEPNAQNSKTNNDPHMGGFNRGGRRNVPFSPRYNCECRVA